MKIAFYTDAELLESETSDARYLVEGLSGRFDLSVHHEPDVSLCDDAEVVFSRFTLAQNRQFLSRLLPLRGKLIINEPAAVLGHTKRHLLSFPGLTVPTIISSSPDAILSFAGRHGSLVFKPLDRHKGQGVILVDPAGMRRSALAALVADYIDEYDTPVVQPYIARVRETGDKRINIFGFEVISAVVTYAADGSFICHESAGGTAEAAMLTAHDTDIVARVMPFLRAKNIWWAALDVIGPYLGEVNIATPSMVRRADQAHGNTNGLDAILRTLQRHADRR